jgi:AAA domain-containing protein
MSDNGSGGFEIDQGIQRKPERMTIYGPPGIGKSTLASNAPDPIFLDLEQGSLQLDVARNKKPIETYDALLGAVKWVTESKHEYKSLVIDTLDRAEWLIHQHVCANNREGHALKPVSRIEDVGGGYMKGYVAAYEEGRRLTAALERCWSQRGMYVILVAHAKLATVKNPAGPDYQRWELKLHEKLAALFYETSDIVLFCSPATVVSNAGYADKRFRAAESGRGRVMHTRGSTSFSAKTRYAVPSQLPLDWNRLFEEIAKASNPKVLLETIEEKLKVLGDKVAEAKIREYIASVKGDAKKLVPVVNRIDVLLEEKAEREAAATEAAQQSAGAA